MINERTGMEEESRRESEENRACVAEGEREKIQKRVENQVEPMTCNTSGVERRKQKTQAMTGGQLKNPRFEEDVVDPSVCCMCFGTYEEDILGAGLTRYLVLVAA